MNATENERSGVFAFLYKLLEGGLALVEDRVERVAVDLREEKKHLIKCVILAGAMVAFGLMTMMLASLLLVVLFWENARVEAVAGLALVYLVITLVAWRSLRLQLKKLPFSGTLRELGKDRQRLASIGNGNSEN